MSKPINKEGNKSSKIKTSQKNSQHSDVIKNIDSLRTKIKKENASLPKSSNSNMNRGIIAALIIVILFGAIGYFYFFYTPPSGSPLPNGHQPCSSLGGFTCDASVTPLTNSGKIVIVYVGAEYCPYCAAERWAIVTALETFGTFSGLQPIASAAETGIPSIYTYTFLSASYSSSKIMFEPVETEDTNGNPLQSMSSLQSQLFSTYDTKGSIPFISIGEKYFKIGSGVSLSPLEGLSFSAIQNAISSGSGSVYNDVMAESNNIINVINSLLNPSQTTPYTSNAQPNLDFHFQLISTIKTIHIMNNKV